jgi:hypothetical protein
MLAQHEETQILRGMDEIIFNMEHIPVDDIAHFLVKFNPNLAEQLAAALEFEIFDMKEGMKHD